MEGIISRDEGITPRIGAAEINSARSEVGEDRPGSQASARLQFVDLEVYVVKPNKKIRVKATKPFELSPSDIFPVVEGILGPLRVPVPKTPAALDGEYGTGWPKEHIIKICQGHGCKTIDLGQPVAATDQPVAEIVRRQIWPDCRLQRCDHLLQPYFGASTRASSADQLWRKHG